MPRRWPRPGTSRSSAPPPRRGPPHRAPRRPSRPAETPRQKHPAPCARPDAEYRHWPVRLVDRRESGRHSSWRGTFEKTAILTAGLDAWRECHGQPEKTPKMDGPYRPAQAGREFRQRRNQLLRGAT
ncbi:MAG: hypothetical protein CVU33_17985 [Betaproteobacteria bacterium HGW-Betaproteobacteria-6]|nr:MAG: hypothetical protein CVU33_17985 [Betaproteobacteria bacterium HGW-Betaproteobacteria-6]